METVAVMQELNLALRALKAAEVVEMATNFDVIKRYDQPLSDLGGPTMRESLLTCAFHARKSAIIRLEELSCKAEKEWRGHAK
jgi:hypothetical protein